jgi:hypothetical protein
MLSDYVLLPGAGDENRTRMTSLEDRRMAG